MGKKDSTYEAYAKERRENRRKSRRDFFHRLAKNKGAVVGMVMIIILILVAIFADVISPWDSVVKQNALIRLQPPSA